MRKSLLWVLFLLIVTGTQGQQENRGNQLPNSTSAGTYHFERTAVPNHDPNTTLSQFLKERCEHLQTPEAHPKLEQLKESPGGWHATFYQEVDGWRVYRSQFKVNLDKNNVITSWYEHSFPLSRKRQASAQAPLHFTDADITEQEPVWFVLEGELVPATRLRRLIDGYRLMEEVRDPNGNLLHETEWTSYFGTKIDTTVSAMVFLPDPLTSAQVSYGTPYSDDLDADIPELNAERKLVNLRATYDDETGLFSLASDAAVITEITGPFIDPVTSTIPEFHFTRTEDGFEQVNAMYHIQQIKDHVDDLGFSSLVSTPVSIDAHGLFGSDQSSFTPGASPRLNFGEGNVDDAEDADVIVHEYGHALSNAASPGTNQGTERQTLDEAFGDYLAASYSKTISAFQWERVFNWDGHNEFWGGRFVITDDHYPEDLVGNIYQDADIWSATMMQLCWLIGRDTTDAIMLQALYGFASEMDMRAAAQLVLNAEQNLYGGVNQDLVCNILYRRGLVTACDTLFAPPLAEDPFATLVNTEAFAAGSEPAQLNLLDYHSSTLRLFNTLGQELWSMDISPGRHTIDIRPETLRSGIYLLDLERVGEDRTWKLLRIR